MSKAKKLVVTEGEIVTYHALTIDGQEYRRISARDWQMEYYGDEILEIYSDAEIDRLEAAYQEWINGGKSDGNF